MQKIRKPLVSTSSCIVLFVLFAIVSTISCSFTETEHKNVVYNGIANLRSIAFSDSSIVRLNGKWHFWKDELLSSEQVASFIKAGTTTYFKVPGVWDSLSLFESPSSLSSTGTLALELLVPPGDFLWSLRLPDVHGACDIYVNGILLGAIGEVSPKREDYYPDKLILTPSFVAPDGKILLVLHISNFSLPQTGTWDSPLLGFEEAIRSKQISSSVNTSLTSGAMLFMGLYHFALFLLRRKDKSVLVFACICVLMATRNMIMGERLLMDWFSDTEAGWRLAFVIEHLSAHMCLALFFILFRQIFPSEMAKIPVRIVCFISALWLILQVLTPPMISHRFLSWFEFVILLGALWIFYVNICALKAKREGALIIVFGMAIMVITSINDILLSYGIIESMYVASFGMFAFIFSQSFFLSRRFSNLFIAVERYVSELVTLNSSLERFIPKEMLDFLGKRTIVDIKLGNYIEAKMSVFFLDIRNFTDRSETMTPAENFQFINLFLEQFGPIVRNHGGFIDKYLGDGFMALFPGDADDAIKAALAMRRQLTNFNNKPYKEGDDPVRFGIGIHTGLLMLGTIGENLRMDTTVISDTVNTASRLEQLTKMLPFDILLSQETVSSLVTPSRFVIEKLSDEKVKGKKERIRVYALVGEQDENDIEFLEPLECEDSIDIGLSS